MCPNKFWAAGLLILTSEFHKNYFIFIVRSARHAGLVLLGLFDFRSWNMTVKDMLPFLFPFLFCWGQERSFSSRGLGQECWKTILWSLILFFNLIMNDWIVKGVLNCLTWAANACLYACSVFWMFGAAHCILLMLGSACCPPTQGSFRLWYGFAFWDFVYYWCGGFSFSPT